MTLNSEQNGRTYGIVFATDVVENGWRIEMCEQPTGQLVMSAFRAFGAKAITVSMHVDQIDFFAAEMFIEAARELTEIVESPEDDERL